MPDAPDNSTNTEAAAMLEAMTVGAIFEAMPQGAHDIYKAMCQRDAERRIVEWHRERAAYYDRILSEGGLTSNEWARINERRGVHRVSAHKIENGAHR